MPISCSLAGNLDMDVWDQSVSICSEIVRGATILGALRGFLVMKFTGPGYHTLMMMYMLNEVVVDAMKPSLSRTMPPRIQSLLRDGIFTPRGPSTVHRRRLFSQTRHVQKDEDDPPRPKLTHVSDSGAARMVSISD